MEIRSHKLGTNFTIGILVYTWDGKKIFEYGSLNNWTGNNLFEIISFQTCSTKIHQDDSRTNKLFKFEHEFFAISAREKKDIQK